MVVGGCYTLLNEGVVIPLKNDYFNNSNPALQLMDVGWNVLPTIIFLIGIAIVTVTAIVMRRRKKVYV